MNATMYAGFLNRMNDDATLMGLLGKSVGDNPCFRAQRFTPIAVPSVTLREGGGDETPLPGTDAAIPVSGSPVADGSNSIQLDIWVSTESETTPCTGADADAIEERLMTLFVRDTTGYAYYDDAGTRLFRTKGWHRISRSQQLEDDTHLWHNVLRLGFGYILFAPNYEPT